MEFCRSVPFPCPGRAAEPAGALPGVEGLFGLALLRSAFDERACLPAGTERSHLAVVRIVSGAVRRLQHYELVSLRDDYRGQIFAVGRRHVTGAAMRAVVIAHARPFVEPLAAAAGTDVTIAEPCHGMPRKHELRR
jgi:hypothetical protein